MKIHNIYVAIIVCIFASALTATLFAGESSDLVLTGIELSSKQEEKLKRFNQLDKKKPKEIRFKDEVLIQALQDCLIREVDEKSECIRAVKENLPFLLGERYNDYPGVYATPKDREYWEARAINPLNGNQLHPFQLEIALARFSQLPNSALYFYVMSEQSLPSQARAEIGEEILSHLKKTDELGLKDITRHPALADYNIPFVFSLSDDRFHIESYQDRLVLSLIYTYAFELGDQERARELVALGAEYFSETACWIPCVKEVVEENENVSRVEWSQEIQEFQQQRQMEIAREFFTVELKPNGVGGTFLYKVPNEKGQGILTKLESFKKRSEHFQQKIASEMKFRDADPE